MGKRKSNKAKEVLHDFVLQGIKAAAEKEISRIAEEVCNEEVDHTSVENLLNNNAEPKNAEDVSKNKAQENPIADVQKPTGNQETKQEVWRIGYNERANLFGLKNQITKLLMHARK